MKVLEDKVLVEVLARKEVETTEGGILLPESATNPVLAGRVIAYGEKSSGLSYGDKVLFHVRQGLNIQYKGRDLRVLHRKDVGLVLDDGD